MITTSPTLTINLRRFVTLAIGLLYVDGLCAKESFELRVDDVSGLAEPWPRIGGLPFAEGEVSDADQIRVVDQRGAEVPASAGAGEYQITFPDAALVAIHKSNAMEMQRSR